MIEEIRASFVLVQFFFLQMKVQFISYTIVHRVCDLRNLYCGTRFQEHGSEWVQII